MIVPDHVLSIMSGVNPDAVEAEAHGLKKAATGIRETGADVHSTWQGLSAFYEAPEAADLFSATAPVRDDAASFAGQLEKVTGALTTYVAETRVIKRKLTDLYMQAVTFVNKTYAEEEDWRKNEDLVQENNSLLQAVDAQALAFQKAQEKASTSIYSAYGGTAPSKQMCTDGKPLTWGTPEEAENPWYEDMWDGATSFLTGFFGDGLWGDATGLWDLATSPDKWRESFENLMVLGTPAIALLSPKLRGKFGETWKGFGKSFVAWDQWKQDPARALGNTAYNIVTTIIPIGKAGSAGKIAKGTRAAAKVGEALDPLSLTLRAGARLPKVSDIAAQLTHKFGDLGTKLKLDLTRTRVITPHVDPATITWNRPPTPNSNTPQNPDVPPQTPTTPETAASPTRAPARTLVEAPENVKTPGHVPEWMQREHQQSAARTVRPYPERVLEPVGARTGDFGDRGSAAYSRNSLYEGSQDEKNGTTTTREYPAKEGIGGNGGNNDEPPTSTGGLDSDGYDDPYEGDDGYTARTGDAASVPESVSDVPPPKTDGPTFPTTPLHDVWHGEHEPDNDIWGGDGVEYLDAEQREQRRIWVDDQGLIRDAEGRLFDTTQGKTVIGGGGQGRAIFVMDEFGNLYASNFHSAGQFHHSSFLAGGPVAAAGELRVVDGRLEIISDRSGHYQPEPDYKERVVAMLRNAGVNITDDMIKGWDG